eukprot:scaffold207836_cov34-Prasinocladus_malaysianus.AAC.1
MPSALKPRIECLSWFKAAASSLHSRVFLLVFSRIRRLGAFHFEVRQWESCFPPPGTEMLRSTSSSAAHSYEWINRF